MSELIVYSSTSDGEISTTNPNYTTAHNQSEGAFGVSQLARIGQIYTTYYEIMRSFVFFDTSSLPDNAVITQAIMGIYIVNDYSTDEFDITIRNGQSTYPHDPLVVGDYLYSHYSGDGGSLNTSGISSPAYNNITLNSNGRGWINKTGITKLALISSKDIDATLPTQNEYIQMETKEHGDDKPARLVITYYLLSTVTTQAVTNIAVTTLTGNGNITNTGGINCTRRGFCYMEGEAGDPDIGDSVAYDDGSFGTGAYTKSITGLSASTHYRVRAYAINAAGTSYGSTVQTTTDELEVTTQAVTAILEITATGNGNITDTGGENASKRGICWNISGSPTVADSKAEEEGNFGTGAFTALMTGLVRGEEYYVKAYAYNSGGYSYGSEVNFYTYPAVTTQAPTDILRADPTTLTANGLIELDVVEEITTRGFKYGLTETDTWDESESVGYTEGVFSLTLTGLDGDTTYYIRAYATGAWGTKFGAWLEFKTAYPYGANKTEIKSEATASASDIAAVGGKRTLNIENHLIQNQTIADIISAAYLADYKDQKTKLVITRPCPAPYEIGDTVERGARIPYAPAVSAEISYAPAASAVVPYALAGHDMLIRKLSVSFSAGNYTSILELEA